MVDNSNMRLLVNAKAVQKKFVLNFYCHLTLLQPSHIILAIFKGDISFRIFFHMIRCFSFFEIPSTVSISLAAKPFKLGRVVKSRG